MINKGTSLFRFLAQAYSEGGLGLFETKEILQQEIQGTEWKPGRAAMAKSHCWGQPSHWARSQHVLSWQEQEFQPASDRAAGY